MNRLPTDRTLMKLIVCCAAVLLIAVMMLLCAGCASAGKVYDTVTPWMTAYEKAEELFEIIDDRADAEETEETPVIVIDTWDEPIPLHEVVWYGPDVSGWRRSTECLIRLSATRIDVNTEGIDRWPAVFYGKDSQGNDIFVAGNPWIFIPLGPNEWGAATWEWLRPGQKWKYKAACAGDHIKNPRLVPLDWKPQKGVTYGIMVTGLARGGKRNVSERSNVVLVEWR